jgi:hypothetical protein
MCFKCKFLAVILAQILSVQVCVDIYFFGNYVILSNVSES